MSIARLVLSVALFAAAPAMATTWSGLYLARSTGKGYISLQLVEARDGGIVGRYRQVVVTEHGPQARLDAPVSGAVQGTQVIGRIERTWSQGGVIAFSGTRTQSGIRLTGGDGLDGHLGASSAQDEQALIAELVTHAKQVGRAGREAQAEKEATRRAMSGLATLDTALKQADEFQVNGSKALESLNKVPAQYAAVTARHEQLAAKARSMPDGVGRSQVSVAMTQLIVDGLIDTSVKVDQAAVNARSVHDRVVKGLAAAKAACARDDTKGPFEPEFIAKCERVPSAEQATGRLYRELQSLFQRLDTAFKMAEERGNALVTEVDSIR